MRIEAETENRVKNIIRTFWAESPENTLYPHSGERAWDEPLVGFARGDDPLFAELKSAIGPFFWTPREAFGLAFPEEEPEGLSVICYALPQTEATRRDQREQSHYPAERWARSRWLGERFNVALRLHLAAALTEAGHPAVAPERLPDFAYRQSERFGLASNWSERHAAHIAGLGTFGLSEGLITPRGKAVRFGSVVARVPLAPTPRPYTDHQAWCLWYARGTCGVCMHRCPVDAIAPGGHDKDRCNDYIRNVTTPYAVRTYGSEATPCGLCQVKIPCEAKIPL
jgi:epoxyqueuosine reductase